MSGVSGLVQQPPQSTVKGVLFYKGLWEVRVKTVRIGKFASQSEAEQASIIAHAFVQHGGDIEELRSLKRKLSREEQEKELRKIELQTRKKARARRKEAHRRARRMMQNYCKHCDMYIKREFIDEPCAGGEPHHIARKFFRHRGKFRKGVAPINAQYARLREQRGLGFLDRSI